MCVTQQADSKQPPKYSPPGFSPSRSCFCLKDKILWFHLQLDTDVLQPVMIAQLTASAPPPRTKPFFRDKIFMSQRFEVGHVKMIWD
ncbi:hypothetical protein F2P81_000376 [Scophthalmus maximus]|uniref:Uncharacterized protein n=1 Tax=Scophthalmus maximus TaxID=52904 RepID=A0A6A4TL00_SCOMX|nr:hypothetical protein F2P81_000376 [Scophthalmus maximus]